MGCLAPCNDGDFANLIEIIAEDYPTDIYFYAIPEASKTDFIRSVTLKDMSNSGKEYKFKFSVHETIKTLNERFKNERDPNDKTPFVFLFDNTEMNLAA